MFRSVCLIALSLCAMAPAADSPQWRGPNRDGKSTETGLLQQWPAGGFLIANTNNVEKLMAHVMEEVNTHYEIAYPATSTIDDGHFRKIEVKLSRPGLTPLTRSGYFALPNTGAGPLTAEEMAGLRALDTQPRPHAFAFLSRAYRFRDSGGQAQYAIAFEMPISN